MSIPTDNILRGERVRLAALTEADLPAMPRWYDDAAFGRLLDAEPAFPVTENKIKEWIADREKSNTVYLFGVRLLEDDSLIGFLDLDGILWNNQVGWIGIAIGDPAYRDKGYGREALSLGINFAFRELNLHRLNLTVFEYNPRAIHLYESLGFVREGAFREAIYRDGRRYDMLLYGLLRSEWEARSAEKG